MGYVLLENVTVEIPVYNSQVRSLKKALIGMATNGRIGLTKRGVTYIQALRNVNLEILPQERLGLVGSNGAGKSTLLRVLGKVYAPTKGKAIIKGSIGSLIGISLGIDPEATGLENIFLRASLLNIPSSVVKKELESILKFTELGEFINMPVRTYSTGMHMRLAFAVSTMISPEILLMDEWLSVGDQAFQQKASDRLKNLIERSNILVIASHSRTLIERTCTRVVWLENGNIKLDGSPKDVCRYYFEKNRMLPN